MQEAGSLSIPYGSGSRLHRRAGLRTAHYVAGAARRFIGGIYQSRFCRALFFDWRFRPRVVCKDPIRRGVAVQDISFDDCKNSYQVFRVPHARLQTDCHRYIAVTTKNELVPGASLYKLKPYTPNLAPEQNPAFGWGRVGSAPRRLRGTVLSLLSAGWANKNYYHWLTGVLPRIHLMEKSGLIANVDFYLVPDTNLDFQVETLDFLQIPRDARLSSKKARHVAADAIIATTYPYTDVQNIPDWIIGWLRAAFLEKSSPKIHSPLVYIGRGDASTRRLLNEQELFSTVLQPLGFQAYQLSKMPFASQISLFAGADIVVGPHGAGLANLVFCKKGTRVIELQPARDRRKMFQNISRVRELDYHAVVCRDQKADVWSHDFDLIVQLDKVVARLQLDSC